jgi:hypothetical protein
MPLLHPKIRQCNIDRTTLISTDVGVTISTDGALLGSFPLRQPHQIPKCFTPAIRVRPCRPWER